MNKKIIYDITRSDRFEKSGSSAVVWFVGCNMRCIYCYSGDMVFAKEGHYTPGDLLDFLQKKPVEEVILSGGEPTLHDIEPLCRKIRALGVNIRLETNGLHPRRLRRLAEAELLQFVALDFKAETTRFGYITGSSRYKRFLESLDFLIGAKQPFEVRTTVHPDLLDKETIEAMAKELYRRGYRGTYYLQPYVETGRTIANIERPSRSFEKEPLRSPLPVLWRHSDIQHIPLP